MDKIGLPTNKKQRVMQRYSL